MNPSVPLSLFPHDYLALGQPSVQDAVGPTLACPVSYACSASPKVAALHKHSDREPVCGEEGGTSHETRKDDGPQTLTCRFGRVRFADRRN